MNGLVDVNPKNILKSLPSRDLRKRSPIVERNEINQSITLFRCQCIQHESANWRNCKKIVTLELNINIFRTPTGGKLNALDRAYRVANP